MLNLIYIYSCEEELTIVKTAVMNPTKSKDFKPTQSAEEVVERINTLHRCVNNTSLAQLKYTQNCFNLMNKYPGKMYRVQEIKNICIQVNVKLSMILNVY